MECLNVKIDERNEFIKRFVNHDQSILKFYDYDPNHSDSEKRRMQRQNNGREKEVAQVIRQYMSNLTLTDQQEASLKALEQGAKVVIGGQQAGLLTGPLYTFHKIVSIIVKAKELSASYGETVVPVFWIAGEDHDFEEVNHTYVMAEREGKLQKVKYHTLMPPETSVSNYEVDKEALYTALDDYFKWIPETPHSNALYRQLQDMIEASTKWTDLFQMMVHHCFKSQGLLLIDAHHPHLRQLEKPLLRDLIKNHQQVDQAFRQTQQQLQKEGFPCMIETDTNVHLFIDVDQQRQLLKYNEGYYYTSKTEEAFTEAELLEKVDKEPHLFSNNVVTRPLTEEWLFNTVAFVGGPSEIRYWGELKAVFHLFDIEMPIVLPRMRITYLTPKSQKLIHQYNLSANEIILEGIEQVKDTFIRAKASDKVLEDIDTMIGKQQAFYEQLEADMSQTEDNRRLLKKNHDIQLHQYRYLKKRYLTNIERENEISMRHFNQLSQTLHPMGGLQERIWNPIQLLNEYGIDMFDSAKFPPLSYTFEQIVIGL